MTEQFFLRPSTSTVSQEHRSWIVDSNWIYCGYHWSKDPSSQPSASQPSSFHYYSFQPPPFTSTSSSHTHWTQFSTTPPLFLSLSGLMRSKHTDCLLWSTINFHIDQQWVSTINHRSSKLSMLLFIHHFINSCLWRELVRTRSYILG